MRIAIAVSAGLLFCALVACVGADDGAPAARAKPSAFLTFASAGPAATQAEEPKVPNNAKDKAKVKGKEQPVPLPQPAQPQTSPAPPVDQFANAPDLGGDAPIGLNPNMIGDFPGIISYQHVLLPTTQTIQTFHNVLLGYKLVQSPGSDFPTKVPVYAKEPLTVHVHTAVSTIAPVVQAFSGSFKVAENQSPMPTDRAYLTYNFYDRVGVSTPSQLSTQTVNYGGYPSSATTVIPSSPRVDLHREMFGFEKTFLDGAGSIGMRLPFAQVQGDGSVSQQDIGDMSWLLNYAFYRNVTTGNVFTGGLMATVPTGPPQYSIAGNIHPALMQPFVGYRWVADRFYLQGFSSTAVPTDPRFVTAMFNDLSAGFWLYRARGTRLITALVPTLEAHVTTPLNHRGPDNLISVPDIVAMTAGLQIGLRNRAILALGVIVPVTGPQVFPVEAVAQFNWRY